MNFSAIEDAFFPSPDKKCTAADGGIVASAFPLATQAGVAMLHRGGNAVDAACSAALALGVCEPQASGLGGESKAIVCMNNATVAVDGSSRVPAGIDINTVSDEELHVGYRGTSIPSTVAVLGYLHQRYGSLMWREVVEPSIRIAREGYRITPLQHALQARELPLFLQVPSLSGARYFLKDGKQPYGVEELFIQPDLASLLEDLADFGPEFFYTKAVAKRIEEDMKANGGYLRADDLARIPWPVERKPIEAQYRGFNVATVPPPSGGRMLLFTLSLLDRLPPSFLGRRTGPVYQMLCEIFKSAVRQETDNPPDPDTYSFDHDPVFLTSGIEEATRSVQRLLPADSLQPALQRKEGETTHLSVMDQWGNAVGITQSINLVYGPKAAADGLGFIYNNYLINMNRKDRRHPHFLRPNAVSSSYAAPCILFTEGEPWMVAGSPGSERIFSTITQFVSHVLDGGMPICEAVAQPRMHCFPDNRVCYESPRFPEQVIAHLKEQGYRLEARESWSFYLGAIHAVVKRRSGRGFQGVAEVRRDGTAEGI